MVVYSDGMLKDLEEGVFIPNNQDDKDEISWSKVQKIVHRRDGTYCQICYRNGGKEVGHIIDRAIGGVDQPSNCVIMCHECNILKPYTHTIDQYKRWAILRYVTIRAAKYEEANFLAAWFMYHRKNDDKIEGLCSRFQNAIDEGNKNSLELFSEMYDAYTLGWE